MCRLIEVAVKFAVCGAVMSGASHAMMLWPIPFGLAPYVWYRVFLVACGVLGVLGAVWMRMWLPAALTVAAGFFVDFVWFLPISDLDPPGRAWSFLSEPDWSLIPTLAGLVSAAAGRLVQLIATEGVAVTRLKVLRGTSIALRIGLVIVGFEYVWDGVGPLTGLPEMTHHLIVAFGEDRLQDRFPQFLIAATLFQVLVTAIGVGIWLNVARMISEWFGEPPRWMWLTLLSLVVHPVWLFVDSATGTLTVADIVFRVGVSVAFLVLWASPNARRSSAEQTQRSSPAI